MNTKELRLEAIRREAEQKGRVEMPGIRPAGSPMPVASPETGYYGQHLLKEPQWTHLVPLYFFAGGATGVLGVIGPLADLLGNEREMARTALWMAFGGAMLSSVLLIVDLGRPSRFLNMLRIFKPQSAMSVGSWVLSAFSVSAGFASFSDALRAWSNDGFVAKAAAALGRTGTIVFGIPLHNYTGVLIGATAIPAWHSHVQSLPKEFGMSGLQSAVCLLELAGYDDRLSLNALGLLGAGVASAEAISVMKKNNRASRPLKKGRSGFLITLGAVLSGAVPIALRSASLFLNKASGRKLRKAAAISGIMGSLCMRYGWVEAGSVSARDWRIPLEIEKS